MHHRKQTKVLFALVFFTAVLLGYGPLWAQSATPNFTETIIDGNTKVVSNSDGTVTVYFWDEDCTSSDPDVCWGEPATAQQGVICTCVGYFCQDADGNDLPLKDLVTPQTDLGPNPELDPDVRCYTIDQAGAGTTGCLVSRNPRTYLIGGDAYTRP